VTGVGCLCHTPAFARLNAQLDAKFPGEAFLQERPRARRHWVSVQGRLRPEYLTHRITALPSALTLTTGEVGKMSRSMAQPNILPIAEKRLIITLKTSF
jgi:hypothetical protein